MPENTVPAEFVKIESFEDLETISTLEPGDFLFRKKDDPNTLYKMDAEVFYQVLNNFARPIAPADSGPFTADRWYKPTVSSADPGTNYPNAGNLKARSGFDTLFWYNGTTWTKTEVQLPEATANGAVVANDVKAISGDTAFKTIVEGAIVTVYTTWEAGYYFTTGGASTGTTYSMQRTPKILLKKGETLKFGVNTFNTSGGTAAIFNLYNLDGSFKSNVLAQNSFLNQFKEYEYTATEDVLFALVDFSTATFGQEYIHIHSVNKAALNPLDSRVTTLEGSQSEIFNGITSPLPAQSIPVNLDSYYTATGGQGGNGSGHKRTDKFLLKKGRTVNFGVNIFTSNGIAILNLYNLDGTFLANIIKPAAGNYSTFYTGSYTAVEDVKVGISDYTNGGYGTAYVTIAAQEGSNYNKGLSYLLDNDSLKVKTTDYEATKMYLRGSASQNLSAVKKIGFIELGQSNMDGRVPTAQLPSYISSNNNTVPGVQMWNDSAKAFQPFKFGTGGNTGQEAPGAAPSPLNSYAFDAIASYLLAQYKSQTIYLIKRSQGGTAISTKGTDGGGYWTPYTELIPAGKNKLIEEFKTKILNALAVTPDLEIKGCTFHQGEGDYMYVAAVDYYQGLKDLIDYVRGIVKNPKLPFIFGTIAPVSQQYSPIVNAAFNKIAAEDKFVHLVDMSDGTLLDASHFDAASTQLLGQRMFDVMKNL